MENPHPFPKGDRRIFFSLSDSWRRLLLLVLMSMLLQFQGTEAQQTYVNNKQLDCEKNYTNALGYVCNSNSSASCASYLTFRSNPTYNSAATIGYLLGADPTEIARANNISDIDPIPTDTLLIVPVTNCSCSGHYQQHNTSYVLKASPETYFSVANNTYQGLTTCQSLISQNPSYNYRHLLVGMKLTVPLRCACPSPNQTSAGFRYLLTYLITWGDTIESIAQIFGSDYQSIYQANLLSPDNLIFPFTPILVPLKAQPAFPISSPVLSPPPPPPSAPAVPEVGDSNSSHRWLFVGIGIGGAALLLFSLAALLFWFFRRQRKAKRDEKHRPVGGGYAAADEQESMAEKKSWSVSSEGVRYAIGGGWLTAYEFEELQKATGYFGEANRIKGSVYRGCFKGDDAAVKIMKGDVSAEINMLKQINHSNIIRLSGFCLHQDNTYLVYEYAHRGSLNDCLIHHHHYKTLLAHSDSYSNSTATKTTLSWKQRVQIAYDVADALNYLHNYSNPPYIHKNLNSSNVLLDSNFRAKISNFSLARTVEPQHTTTNSKEHQDQGQCEGRDLLQLTRHVVGTHGYMAPEYIENGLITPKLDVFAFGVVMLELLSGREAVPQPKHKSKDGFDKDKMDTINTEEAEDESNGSKLLLYDGINVVLGGDNVREKLRGFIDPCLRADEYPLDLAYSMAQLAKSCVVHDLNSRPTMANVFTTLSKIMSSSLDWDPSDEFDHSTSLSRGR
ncbi:hypothetical protein LguiB_013502 [Lonicera macranthoides]